MTNPNDLSQMVQSLLASHINSVTQLEVLLLLHQQQGRTWSSHAVAKELRIDTEAAEHQLSDLCSHGFLRRIGELDDLVYQYRARSYDLDRSVQELAHTYQERRHSVIRLIFSKPLEHIRTFSNECGASNESSDNQG